MDAIRKMLQLLTSHIQTDITWQRFVAALKSNVVLMGA